MNNDVIYPSTQHYSTTLQPLHHQLTSLTYGGAQVMDVTGGDKTWVPSKSKASSEGNSEEKYRKVGQNMRYTLK